ncbi:MAG: tRNA guanosine(15) transglycosylase TgtA [Thermoplasmatales archaeon]|nr:MAG: tRNA guanosine(15) transglycosylase TgtA [Thermoplasmatales archaeon]
MKFEIKDRDAAGRVCKFTTKHGTITTPNLMPVVNPNKMLISPREMKKLFGTEIVITNSYVISKYEELKKKALQNGIHKLIDFDGPIMTDSGAFQTYVYGDVDIDPIEIVKFQRDIGSDIGTILDVFGTPDLTRKEAEGGVKETIKRAKMSASEKNDMLLACTVQGSIYPDLRMKCAKEISKIDADFYPIGGVVPLMENQRYADVVRCIISSKQGLDPSKPVHLFGAGHPLIFPLAVALGCDLFDSSAYAKYATDGRMIFPWGTEKIMNINEIPCCCPVCTKFTASELKKLEKSDLSLRLAEHNLHVSFTEMKKIRNAIAEGNLWEVVERRTSSNPYLLDALKVLRKTENKIWLEKFESVSKNKALFYTGNHTIHRPIIYRIHRRLLNRYEHLYNTTVVFPEGNKPYSTYYSRKIKEIFKKKNVNLVVRSHLGPVPIELDEMYPFAQSVFPKDIDIETQEESRKIFDEFLKEMKVIPWKESTTSPEPDVSEKKKTDMDLRRISAVSDMQFGKGASEALFNGQIEIVKSKKTGKIRNIYCDGKHILSMRASDGMFTLKIGGAHLLHKFFKYPMLRVVVEEDAVPFVREGKSVFAKFVKDCDPALIPLDECLIVNTKDTLLAVGRCLLNKTEMLSFDYGIAVKTRETNN